MPGVVAADAERASGGGERGPRLLQLLHGGQRDLLLQGGQPLGQGGLGQGHQGHPGLSGTDEERCVACVEQVMSCTSSAASAVWVDVDVLSESNRDKGPMIQGVLVFWLLVS